MVSVLYVDDEPALLNLGKIFIEKLGDFSVTIIDSASEALSLLIEKKFDAIVSDYQMPGMDGISFLKEVRSLHGKIPFILFTGRGREEVVIDAINNGADFYLQKGGDAKSQFVELTHKINQAVKRYNTEHSLIESQKRLADIIDFLPDATFAIDNEGRIIAWNRAIEEMTGVPAKDIIGKGNYEYAYLFYGKRFPVLIDLINEPDEKIKLYYENFHRSGESVFAESDLSHPKGNKIYIMFKASPLYNQEGVVTGAIETIRDITVLKNTELALKESENRFRSYVENSPDLIFRISLPDGRMQYISPVSVLYTGYEPEAFYSDPTLSERILHKDSKIFFNQVWNKYLLKKEIDLSYDYKIVDKSGEIRWFSQRNKFLYDILGNPVELEGIITDITEKKKTEHDLWRSEQRFQAVTKYTGSWIWEIDSDGMYVYSNPVVEEILGYTPEELVGKLHFYDLFEPSKRDEFKNTAMDLISSLKPFKEFINVICHKNGDSVLMSTGGMPVFDENRNYIGYCGVDQDITYQKKIEDSLRKANTQLNLFSSFIRHDILNKVAVILGYIAVIEMEFSDPELLNYISRMKRATVAVKEQIVFTRLYRDLGIEDPKWIEPESIISKIHIPEGISLETDIKGLQIFADPIFEKIFEDLLSNSVLHGERTTKVVVSYHIVGESLILVFEDDGVGIKENEKELIFQKNYGKDNGLGLFLVKEVLLLTNITIRETGIEGEGARFELSVPKGCWRIYSDN